MKFQPGYGSGVGSDNHGGTRTRRTPCLLYREVYTYLISISAESSYDLDESLAISPKQW